MLQNEQPKDRVWSEFLEKEVLVNNILTKQFACINCGTIVSGKTDRLRAHSTKCPKNVFLFVV
jgi:predicted RNA-binding Zn-ribbon protein involved in translation (DUF1610 family)